MRRLRLEEGRPVEVDTVEYSMMTMPYVVAGGVPSKWGVSQAVATLTLAGAEAAARGEVSLEARPGEDTVGPLAVESYLEMEISEGAKGK